MIQTQRRSSPAAIGGPALGRRRRQQHAVLHHQLDRWCSAGQALGGAVQVKGKGVVGGAAGQAEEVWVVPARANRKMTAALETHETAGGSSTHPGAPTKRSAAVCRPESHCPLTCLPPACRARRAAPALASSAGAACRPAHAAAQGSCTRPAGREAGAAQRKWLPSLLQMARKVLPDWPCQQKHARARLCGQCKSVPAPRPPSLGLGRAACCPRWRWPAVQAGRGLQQGEGSAVFEQLLLDASSAPGHTERNMLL